MNSSLDTDRAISDGEADELGFLDIARSLAPRLVDASTGEGMVVGIEGRWGTGKSSLMNLTRQQIEEQSNNNVHAITVAPWIDGDESPLVSSLLSQIAHVLSDSESDPSSNLSIEDVKELAKSLAAYSAKTARWLSPMSKVAGKFIPGAGQFGEMIEVAGDVGEKFAKSGMSPADLKESISDQLKKLDHTFIVFIDDLDRLEPAQAVEVVRLVRSVAEFPKVVYVICYDREVLGNALAEALNVDDGDLFLQKIIQLTFQIPLPEPFDLRKKFMESAVAVREEFNSDPISEQESSDLKWAIDVVGGNLTTPREVKLALNSIRFVYPAVFSSVYFPDLCWLNLLKTTNFKLHRWIEEYLLTRSVVATGVARVSKDERKALGKRLKELAPSDDYSSDRSIFYLQSYIPGISHGKDSEEIVFNTVYEDEEAKKVNQKRVGSPAHYRYYFSLSAPTTAMSDSALGLFLISAEDGKVCELTTMLKAYANTPNQEEFDHLLFRLNRDVISNISVIGLSTIIKSIFDVMDNVLTIQNDPAFGQPALDERVAVLSEFILKEIGGHDRTQMCQLSFDIATDGLALNWLVGSFFNHQMFSHGRAGDEPQKKENPLYLDQELDQLIEVLNTRLRKSETKGHIGGLPRIRLYLFGWANLSGENIAAKEWVESFCADDSNFLRFLKHCRYKAISDKVYRPLSSEGVSAFLDWEETKNRLAGMRDGRFSEEVKEIEESIRIHEQS